MNIPTPARCILLLAISLLGSCATYREQVWRKENDPAQVRPYQWAKVCQPYAIMSYLAYFSGDPETGMKQSEVKGIKEYETQLEGTGWRLLGNCEPGKGEDGYGLYFDVWENRTTSPREVVFAFRGTQSNDINDWLANLRWFRWASHVGHDQYATARKDCLLILGDILSDREAKKARVVTTGHSLGGGLAQMVLYRSVPWVDQAIVFDPSPVTGFFDLDRGLQDQYYSLPFRDSFAGGRVIRVYAKGEILQYARNVIQLFSRPHPLVYSVEFQTGGAKGLISKHSMLELTKTICAAAASRPLDRVVPQTLPQEKPTFFRRFHSHLDMLPPPPAPSAAVNPPAPASHGG